MTEGSLEAPERRPLPWRDPDFLDEEKLDAEMRRQFDVCHGCRRCHNLCDSFPRLFDLIDESESLELDSVSSEDLRGVVDACTLCDMCFMTKCPYVPPHEFNLDVPHLMLRYRAVQHGKGETGFARRQLAETDRNGRLAAPVAGLANWATGTGNGLVRPVVEAATGIDRRAEIPRFHGRTLTARARAEKRPANRDAPAFGRKAVVYATCFVNYNDPGTGEDALELLARNGVETEVVHPVCCGMPKLEHGDIAGVARNAEKVAAELAPWADKGFDVVALTPSCTLMLKFEWPLLLPENGDVRRLADATRDVSEYIVDIARNEGLADAPQPLEGGVTVHLACHARAQNAGRKAAEMMRLIPDTEVDVIERCSGHGGSWGMMKGNFDTALKIGRPAARRAVQAGRRWVVSECPLAGLHLRQGMAEAADAEDGVPRHVAHPIRLLAQACRGPEARGRPAAGNEDTEPSGSSPGGAAGARPKILTPELFMSADRYEAERPARRKALLETKRGRRLAVGPHATFHFENHETMWYQVQEMLRIERGGEEQLRDEIAAYGPLVPQGRELVATVMFEIADPERRAEILAKLGGVEECMSISVGGRRVAGVPEADLDRTSADGKASSVQFVHFPFDDEALEEMRSGSGQVVVAVEHPAYAHMAVMPDEMRRTVCEDFEP